jgi:hypothetical protein
MDGGSRRKLSADPVRQRGVTPDQPPSHYGTAQRGHADPAQDRKRHFLPQCIERELQGITGRIHEAVEGPLGGGAPKRAHPGP